MELGEIAGVGVLVGSGIVAFLFRPRKEAMESKKFTISPQMLAFVLVVVFVSEVGKSDARADMENGAITNAIVKTARILIINFLMV
ncbi:MAG: hypothetical protein ABR875_03600 [Minisyncoccia bacterium]|jgi:hypothetical protein